MNGIDLILALKVLFCSLKLCLCALKTLSRGLKLQSRHFYCFKVLILLICFEKHSFKANSVVR